MSLSADYSRGHLFTPDCCSRSWAWTAACPLHTRNAVRGSRTALEMCGFVWYTEVWKKRNYSQPKPMFSSHARRLQLDVKLNAACQGAHMMTDALHQWKLLHNNDRWTKEETRLMPSGEGEWFGCWQTCLSGAELWFIQLNVIRPDIYTQGLNMRRWFPLRVHHSTECSWFFSGVAQRTISQWSWQTEVWAPQQTCSNMVVKNDGGCSCHIPLSSQTYLNGRESNTRLCIDSLSHIYHILHLPSWNLGGLKEDMKH